MASPNPPKNNRNRTHRPNEHHTPTARKDRTKVLSETKVFANCLKCNAKYCLLDKGTSTGYCKTCKAAEDKYIFLKKYDSQKNVISKESAIQEEYVGLSPAELVMYSDTKQVWWVRVLKWILKNIFKDKK